MWLGAKRSSEMRFPRGIGTGSQGQAIEKEEVRSHRTSAMCHVTFARLSAQTKDILGIREDYPAEAHHMGKNEGCDNSTWTGCKDKSSRGAADQWLREWQRYRRVQGRSCQLQGCRVAGLGCVQWCGVAGTRHEESLVLWILNRVQGNCRFSAQ
ncbi:hypothetical protein BJV74DRAFT_855930 [Russula compacta]|nr:hypothetical protein BJV74DRAFT_855930 [Russula compacta]